MYRHNPTAPVCARKNTGRKRVIGIDRYFSFGCKSMTTFCSRQWSPSGVVLVVLLCNGYSMHLLVVIHPLLGNKKPSTRVHGRRLESRGCVVAGGRFPIFRCSLRGLSIRHVVPHSIMLLQPKRWTSVHWINALPRLHTYAVLVTYASRL